MIPYKADALTTLTVLAVALAAFAIARAQESAKAPLQAGIHVQMAVASHVVEMPAADQQDATVVSVTADGKMYVGGKPIDRSALSGLKGDTVYLKADARAPYQQVLTILDALHGRSVGLLTAPASKTEKGKMVPPYGLTLTVDGQ